MRGRVPRMTLKEPLSELWRYETVRCVAVSRGPHVQLELRNAEGAAFFRKCVPTRQAAMMEAEDLRLLVGAPEGPVPAGSLRPFAVVIEDDRNGFHISDALRASGMRTIACPGGAEGVVMARELQPDLIVLDFSLAEIAVADLCRMILTDPITASLPIVVVTTSADGRLEPSGGLNAIGINSCQIETLPAAARHFVGQTTAPGATQ